MLYIEFFSLAYYPIIYEKIDKKLLTKLTKI